MRQLEAEKFELQYQFTKQKYEVIWRLYNLEFYKTHNLNMKSGTNLFTFLKLVRIISGLKE